MAVTAREIQFVRARLGYGSADIPDADIANGLEGSYYLARVRLSIAAEDFTLAVKGRFPRLAAFMARRS